ncbi:hypothetical protein CBER1_11527 [Cercospora berteroae]|uniref:Integrase zinc-binding domain-containing protein n=1 Tax=Cercospora berteroae TaxID=357750 RepID=A0A2S6CH54_9PEZI|nr:hypothetical protein CBER1_11527 [Cercospora berteroae]
MGAQTGAAAGGRTPQGGRDRGEEEAAPLGLQFFLRNDLIYFKDDANGRERLCIPRPLYAEIFKIAHNNHHHSGFHRSYARVSASFYVRHLAKELRKYIKHCPACLLNQTYRHRPYGELQPIQSVAVPDYTVTADWVFGLPSNEGGFDGFLTETCKFTKRVILTKAKSTWTAAEHGAAWIHSYVVNERSLPSIMIGNRDPIWMSEFMQAAFRKLGTRFLATTAYHP